MIERFFNEENNEKNVKKLISNLAEELELTKYVRNINVYKGTNLTSDAAYFYYFMRLNVYLGTIKKSFKNEINNHNIKYINQDDYDHHLKVFILDIILHELSHANQAKIADENIDDSLHALARDSIGFAYNLTSFGNLRDKLVYKFYYDYVLAEKNAECEAKRIMLELNDYYEFLDKYEEKFVKGVLKDELNLGYNEKSAAENYFILRGKKDKFDKIKFGENYDLYTKKSWGMPLTKKN